MTNGTVGKFFHFDPTVNTGNLLQVLVLVGSVFFAYSALKQDQVIQQLKVEQVKVDVEADRRHMKESLDAFKNEMREMNRNISEVNTSLAVLKAQAAQPAKAVK